MCKQVIAEEMQVQNEWYKEAKEMTLEKLPDFINKLLNDYGHDYGTICHALTAGAIATAWAMNKHEQGGITGFQAGAIMWEFIKHWNYTNNKTALKIIDYDDFLYPQHDYKFEKTLNRSIWEAIQTQARDNIKKAYLEHQQYLKDLEQYRIDIAKFVEKYQDYYQRREYYDKLFCGTQKEWDEYYAKVEAGFEFAPTEPYEPVNETSPVYRHWQTISNGKIPFGYRVSEE